ncbi:hypothetical protein [Streptomyces sp. UG1]|uniref:hypothetical protein n=1 Tax=Streptomyces sp. UG1 TaxID=3417652 RepID=UPI003CF5FD64
MLSPQPFHDDLNEAAMANFTDDEKLRHMTELVDWVKSRGKGNAWEALALGMRVKAVELKYSGDPTWVLWGVRAGVLSDLAAIEEMGG